MTTLVIVLCFVGLLLLAGYLAACAGGDRLLTLGEWLGVRGNKESLFLHMQAELYQLGYTVRDGSLYPPEDSAEWNRLVDAALKRRPMKPNTEAKGPRSGPA